MRFLPTLATIAILLFPVRIDAQDRGPWRDVPVFPSAARLITLGDTLVAATRTGFRVFDDHTGTWIPYGPRWFEPDKGRLYPIGPASFLYLGWSGNDFDSCVYYNATTGMVRKDTTQPTYRHVWNDSIVAEAEPIVHGEQRYDLVVTWWRHRGGDTIRRDTVRVRNLYVAIRSSGSFECRNAIVCDDGSWLFFDSTASLRFRPDRRPELRELPLGVSSLAVGAVSRGAWHTIKADTSIWLSKDDGATWIRRIVMTSHHDMLRAHVALDPASDAIYVAVDSLLSVHRPGMDSPEPVYRHRSIVTGIHVHRGTPIVMDGSGLFAIRNGVPEAMSEGLPGRGARILHANRDGIVALGTYGHAVRRYPDTSWRHGYPAWRLGEDWAQATYVSGTSFDSLCVHTQRWALFCTNAVDSMVNAEVTALSGQRYVPYGQRWLVTIADSGWLTHAGVILSYEGGYDHTLTAMDLHSIVGFEDHMMVYGRSGCFRSDDGGRHWTPDVCSPLEEVPVWPTRAVRTVGDHGLIVRQARVADSVFYDIAVSHDGGRVWSNRRHRFSTFERIAGHSLAGDGRPFVVTSDDERTIRLYDMTSFPPAMVGTELRLRDESIRDFVVDHAGRTAFVATTASVRSCDLPVPSSVEGIANLAATAKSDCVPVAGASYERVHDLQGRLVGTDVARSALPAGMYIVVVDVDGRPCATTMLIAP